MRPIFHLAHRCPHPAILLSCAVDSPENPRKRFSPTGSASSSKTCPGSRPPITPRRKVRSRSSASMPTPASANLPCCAGASCPSGPRTPRSGSPPSMPAPKKPPPSPPFAKRSGSAAALVPADAFYEWQRLDPKNKQPYAIAMRSGKPYAFAGLWDRWRPKEGPALETFTILTTDPNELTEPIHNRMPVILEPSDYGRWMEAGDPTRPPVDLLRPYPAEKMLAWPVDNRVGNVRNDDAQLLDAAQPAKDGYQ